MASKKAHRTWAAPSLRSTTRSVHAWARAVSEGMASGERIYEGYVDVAPVPMPRPATLPQRSHCTSPSCTTCRRGDVQTLAEVDKAMDELGIVALSEWNLVTSVTPGSTLEPGLRERLVGIARAQTGPKVVVRKQSRGRDLICPSCGETGELHLSSYTDWEWDNLEAYDNGVPGRQIVVGLVRCGACGASFETSKSYTGKTTANIFREN